MRRLRPAVGGLLAAFLWLAGPGAGLAQNAPVPEYELKAEFVGRFPIFVDWPPDALPAAGEPFVIGVVGDSPVGQHLDRRLAGEIIEGHPVEVHDRLRLDEVASCHILFVAASAAPDLDRILARTGERPILTVADSAGFGERGVLINFFVVGRNVRFEINEAAVRRSGMTFRSKLYRLATIVGPEVG